MKKYIIRVVAFVLLFCLCFAAAQSVLHYRWSVEDDLYTKNILYSRASDNSIDILTIGTSELYDGYTPIVGYEESGVTGFNFGMAYRSAMTAYYQLLYALEYQTPSVVVCDFSCLFDDMLPSEAEPVHRKVVECMPDKKLKEQLIREICAVDKSQSYLSWEFPLLRYHSRWNELTDADFSRDYLVNADYPSYQKGAGMTDIPRAGSLSAIVPELWNCAGAEPEPMSQYSIHYYDLIIEACKERGIPVVAVFMPSISHAFHSAVRWDATKAYLDSRGVPCLNYCTYEQVQRLGLNLDDHYCDDSHLNVAGSVIFTKAFIHDLQEILPLPDHRGDAHYQSEWDVPLAQFREKYPAL